MSTPLVLNTNQKSTTFCVLKEESHLFQTTLPSFFNSRLMSFTFGINTNTTSSTNTTSFNPLFSSTTPAFNFNTSSSQQSSLSPSLINWNPNTPSSSSSFSSFTVGSSFAGSTFAPNSLSTPLSRAPTSSYLSSIHSSNPLEDLDAIARSWDPSNVNCRFRHVFYNIVDPQLVPILRERKPDKFPEKLWYQALQNVPDPSCMIPVLAVGFKDLKIRIQEQDKMTAQQLSTLKDIELYIAQLHQKHNLDTTLKLEEYKRRHLELTRRVVRVMKKKEVLTSQGYPPLKSEELFRARLESIQRELNKPNQFKAVLSDLHSTVSMMLNNATTSSVESAISSGSLSADEITSVDRSPTYPQFETLDDESIEKIYTFLEEQSKGLQQLTDLLKMHLRHLQIIADGLTETTKLKLDNS